MYKRQRKNDPHVCSYCARGHVELKEPSLYGMMRHETVCKKVGVAKVQLSLVQFSSLRGSALVQQNNNACPVFSVKVSYTNYCISVKNNAPRDCVCE